MTIGKKIKSSRKKKGLTQGELGKRVGLSQNALSLLENDELKKGVDTRTLIRIAKALEDFSVLAHFCESCPVRHHLVNLHAQDLNAPSQDRSGLPNCLGKEILAIAEALQALSEQLPTGLQMTGQAGTTE